jgi:lipoyl(octanoyl) transferase
MLGLMDWESTLGLQRRLAYQVSGQRSSPGLILCEHDPLISVGRQGSMAHLTLDRNDLTTRRWPIRWVNRGGGCILHTPGQLAIYPVVALDELGLSVPAYLDELREMVRSVLVEFDIRARLPADDSDVYVGPRPIACLGIAVRNWVSYFGIFLNVNPDLHLYRRVHCAASGEPMTSMERERRCPIRSSRVRERVVERFADRFGCSETALFFDHPALSPKARRDAVAAPR